MAEYDNDHLYSLRAALPARSRPAVAALAGTFPWRMSPQTHFRDFGAVGARNDAATRISIS